MTTALLNVSNLRARVAEKEIIKDLNLTIRVGETHAIMGPNGAGKSTLSYVLAGKADYEVTAGKVIFAEHDLLALKPEERAAEGLFLSMQSPIEIPGVTVSSFLKHAVNAQYRYHHKKELDTADFLKLLRENAAQLNIAPEILKRELNVGFSGGEKKRLEILQMRLLQPRLAILDETDSGLDIDALHTVAEGINEWHNSQNALLIITHHMDLLELIKPDFVHIYTDGHIVKTGTVELAKEIEQNGYKDFVS